MRRLADLEAAIAALPYSDVVKTAMHDKAHEAVSEFVRDLQTVFAFYVSERDCGFHRHLRRNRHGALTTTGVLTEHIMDCNIPDPHMTIEVCRQVLFRLRWKLNVRHRTLTDRERDVQQVAQRLFDGLTAAKEQLKRSVQ